MKRVLLILVAMVAMARPANAHAIHTTLTRVAVDRNVITLNVRAFADDFSATVARFVGRQIPADSSVVVEEVARYIGAFLVVSVAGNPRVQLASCGIKRVKELYWMCFRAVLPNGARDVKLSNQMLTEFHTDQVNIVQIDPPAARRTLLFTRGSKAAAIGV